MSPAELPAKAFGLDGEAAGNGEVRQGLGGFNDVHRAPRALALAWVAVRIRAERRATSSSSMTGRPGMASAASRARALMTRPLRTTETVEVESLALAWSQAARSAGNWTEIMGERLDIAVERILAVALGGKLFCENLITPPYFHPMPMPKKGEEGENVSCYVSERFARKVASLAQQSGMSRSAYVRQILIEAVERGRVFRIRFEVEPVEPRGE